MAFAIKAEIPDPRAKAFSLVAQKTMYGGKHIAEGDTVLLYTDGITEMRNSPGEMFSEDRLRRALGDGDNGPAEVIERLRAAVRAHQANEPAVDDQTLVAARAL